MFPLSDSSGRVIAFSGRILKDDGQSAKYLNSPDTPLFDKSSVLYGLDKAKSFIRRLDYSILVEGQMDLIMSHQAGVKNTVAASGTALSDAESNKEGAVNNLGLLRRLSGNVIIAFDSDAAGRKAAMRAAGIALSLGMDVKIADIQGGKDPADLVLHDPEDWKKVLRAAKPVVEFELDNVMREVTDARKIPKVLRERVFPFIASIESSTDKAYSVKLVSDKTNLPEQAVWDDVRAIEKKMKTEAESVPSRVDSKAEAGRIIDARDRTLVSESTREGTLSASASSRIDLVERRMFGLLDLMEKAQAPAATAYRDRIVKTAGDSYAVRLERIKPQIGDFSFEAEAFYGAEPERWDIHMSELIANFEEDLLNAELIGAMNELRAAERAKDQARMAELAKKCQDLSIKKAEVRKQKK
jgi:DNA primase